MPPVLPATIHGIIQARVDRLPEPARHLLQVAAVIKAGRSPQLMEAVAMMPASGVRDALMTLLQAEILYEAGIVSAPTYHFKHVLLQDAVYDMLSTLHASRVACADCRSACVSVP